MCVNIKKTLSKICKLSPEQYVISGQLKKLNEMNLIRLNSELEEFKYIFVADNPGEKEISTNESEGEVQYLSNGNTKINFDGFIEGFLGLSGSVDVLILNKSLIGTKTTEELRTKIKDGDDSQALIADLAAEMLEKYGDLTLVLMGWTDYFDVDDEGIFSRFFKELSQKISEYPDIEMRICAYPHPSRRQLLTRTEQKVIEENGYTSKDQKEDIFKQYGHLQFNNRKPKDTVVGFIEQYKKTMGR